VLSREEAGEHVGTAGQAFQHPKQLVWEAYEKVKANKGVAGADGQSIEDFESDLRNNLYKIWNRMSSGTYFPPPVMAVEIPRAGSGEGTRILGVPTGTANCPVAQAV
jgi:RNA-directed DNA polymerase